MHKSERIPAVLVGTSLPAAALAVMAIESGNLSGQAAVLTVAGILILQLTAMWMIRRGEDKR